MESFQPVVAQGLQVGGYFSLPKIIAFLILFLLWALLCQWVDRDTDKVKTKREQWNAIVLVGGMTGMLVALLLPWAGPLYFLGVGFWVIFAGGSALWYVVHRNARVVPGQRVLTADHFRRLMTPGPKGAKGREDRGHRVRVADAEGREIKRPEDDDQIERYDATQDFLFDVLYRRASDVELLVDREKPRLIYRIDGVASEQSNGLPPEDAERVVSYLKKIAGLNVEELRRPQSGRIMASLLGQAGHVGYVEVHTSGSTQGERLRLRVLGTHAVLRLPDLGMAPPRLEKLKELIAAPKGLVIFGGPRQGGITTSQYATLRAHDAFLQNIHTVEKSPLMDLENITQHRYKAAEAGDVGYARQLQSILRREAEIVMVGECEDRETAQIASRAASEERKLYVAIHGKDSFDALQRYLTLLEDPKLAAAALLAVVNQRLVRKLCTTCREAFKPDENLLKKLNLPVSKIEYFYRPPTQPILDKKGNEIICQNCQGTGYLGRTGVFELLVIDDGIRALIAKQTPIEQIKAAARKNRMLLMQEEGLLKVIEGVTSLDEIIRGLREEPVKV